jgi:hypothetical protein
MTTTTPTATKISCPECRRPNEPERVYCHDCGARLDRSAGRRKKEPLEDTQKRVRRMFDPQRAKFRAGSVAIGKLIFAAGLVAMIVMMILPPDVPAPTKNAVLVSSLRFDLENMSTKHQPAQKQVGEEEANAFVASVLRPKQSSLDQPFLAFKRALLSFHEKRCAVTVERSISNYWSIYTACVYSLELRDGKFSGSVEAGYIGRLPVHPKLARFIGFLIGDVRAALDRDVKLVSKLGAVEFHDKSVTLSAVKP